MILSTSTNTWATAHNDDTSEIRQMQGVRSTADQKKKALQEFAIGIPKTKKEPELTTLDTASITP